MRDYTSIVEALVRAMQMRPCAKHCRQLGAQLATRISVGIAFRDAGMTRDEVSGAAINAVVGPTGSNMNVADVLLFDLSGAYQSRADMQPYADRLDQGVFTRGSLTSLAADVLDQNINLTGVASYDYTVFAV